jgi:hypothetical protein
MMVLLPDRDTDVVSVEHRLGDVDLGELMRAVRTAPSKWVRVALPKFEVSYEVC